MSEELKPCPFCGGQAELISLHSHNQATCSTIVCPLYVTHAAMSVKAWNTRAQQGVADEQSDAIQAGTVVLGELVMHSWGLVPVNEPIADTGDFNIVWQVLEYHMGDKTVIKGVGYSPEEAMRAALHSDKDK